MSRRIVLLLAVVWLCAAFLGAQATVPVPSPADRPTGAADGWYRTWVRVDDSFFTKHERNLFEESVGLHFRDLVGTHEAFVNGVKVGAGSGREVFRHKVPVGTLRKGEWNEILFHVHQPEGKGGFRGEAPFIMNYFMECVLEGAWEYSPTPLVPG
ncbi:MAG: hypothetical protein EBY80_17135, partial [Actinobacteria bacterium]|nr:hypothetical protein [Actinomycetota bacterium]